MYRFCIHRLFLYFLGQEPNKHSLIQLNSIWFFFHFLSSAQISYKIIKFHTFSYKVYYYYYVLNNTYSMKHNFVVFLKNSF